MGNSFPPALSTPRSVVGGNFNNYPPPPRAAAAGGVEGGAGEDKDKDTDNDAEGVAGTATDVARQADTVMTAAVVSSSSHNSRHSHIPTV